MRSNGKSHVCEFNKGKKEKWKWRQSQDAIATAATAFVAVVAANQDGMDSDCNKLSNEEDETSATLK